MSSRGTCRPRPGSCSSRVSRRHPRRWGSQCRRDARHLQPPVAGFRRPDAGGDRLGARLSCGPPADRGPLEELNPQLTDLRRTSWPVSRILFRPATVDRGRAAATIHLGTPSPGASSGLPAGSGEQPSDACAAAQGATFWPCFGWGLPSHPGHPGCWCALTAPFHPYHPCRWRFVFCGTVPRVTSDCR